MTARSRRSLRIIVAALVFAAFGAGQRAVQAGEEDDLQREIDTQRVSVADLERLDELKATGDEITQLKSWLDEAWSLRSKHEYDQVREVLERTRKQADLIRAKITASKLRAQANAREASLAEVRARIGRTKKSLAETLKKKKALEGSDKVSEKPIEKVERVIARATATRIAPSGALLLPALLSFVMAAACATPPKPRELESYELLRKSNNIVDASKKSPNLVAGAEKLADKSREEWESNDLEDSKRDAIMANIKLKTALALMEQEQQKAKIQTLSAEQAKAEEEASNLAEKLSNENEKLSLLTKYVEARKAAESEKQRLSAQMTSEQQKAQADHEKLALQLASEQKIAAAQLALRTADTVDASKFSKAEYSAASDMLAKASAELQQADYAGAQASAEVAKKNADKATEIAKPLYEQAEQASQNKARDEALARDASGINGADVRLERRGNLQRLVIAVPELFSKRKPDIAPGHDGVISALAELIKKYPTYPVQIIGFTDNRGKASELLAVSAARAQTVYSALASKGVETKRLMASGLGGDDPRFDNKTGPGRAKNNRIEIVFLYH